MESLKFEFPLNKRRGPSIVVLSAITANNLGDDATLISMVQDLQRLAPDAKITVLAKNPDLCGPVAEQVGVPIKKSLNMFIEEFLGNLREDEIAPRALLTLARQLLSQRQSIISGKSILGISQQYLPGLHCLMSADGVAECGGANLTPLWKSYFYQRCLEHLIAANPLLISGQGIDQFEDPDDLKLLVDSLSRAAEITLRERISEQYLRSIGCRAPFHTTGDDALTLQESSRDRTESLLEAAGINRATPYIAFQYRHFLEYYEERFFNLFARFVDEAIEASGLAVPMHFGEMDEREHLKAIAQRMRHRDKFHIVQAHIKPSDAKQLFKLARVTFGISYHTGILSLSSKTPFVGLYKGSHYSQKMHGLSDLYDLPFLPVPICSTNPVAFGRLLKQGFDKREKLSADLGRRHQELVAMVAASRERFIQRVRENPPGSRQLSLKFSIAEKLGKRGVAIFRRVRNMILARDSRIRSKGER
jgi:polysaccharide pyruvyl transferase WcaK-like protein